MAQEVRIVVVGSLVMDLIFDVPEWPVRRKAVQATSFVMQPGGKGLNQATAAARLGAQVSAVSAIGQDQLGDMLLTNLENNHIDDQFVERRSAADTDATAVIIEKGEPGFIGAKIATQTVDARLIRNAEAYIRNANVVMATGGIPLNAIETAFEIAKEHRVTTIFNPAPPERLPSSILTLTDYLVPNEWEASVVVGENRGGYLSAEHLAKRLRREGAHDVIVTTGDLGCVALIGDEVKNFDGFEVEAIDTTGASDAFCAALAVALAKGKNISDAITIACASGALACTKFGAATSMPEKSALSVFLNRVKPSINLD